MKQTANFIATEAQNGNQQAIEKLEEFNKIGFSEEKENYLIFNEK